MTGGSCASAGVVRWFCAGFASVVSGDGGGGAAGVGGIATGVGTGVSSGLTVGCRVESGIDEERGAGVGRSVVWGTGGMVPDGIGTAGEATGDTVDACAMVRAVVSDGAVLGMDGPGAVEVVVTGGKGGC